VTPSFALRVLFALVAAGTLLAGDPPITHSEAEKSGENIPPSRETRRREF
jgi:hypothetical protein